MRFYTIFLSLCLMAEASTLAAVPTAKEILQRIDANQAGQNMFIESSMTIHGVRGKRTISSRSWVRGEKTSFSEYLAPARERGTKMLRLGDRLWLYTPRADRTIAIAGHMLRQPMMGSDLSYEDMMSNVSLVTDYDAQLLGEEKLDGHRVWVLELKAKSKEVAYRKRKIWVDQKMYQSRKQELFATSGKMIKLLRISKFFKTKRGWYPRVMLFKDTLKEGKGTEFTIHKLEFDPKVSSSRFTKGALRR